MRRLVGASLLGFVFLALPAFELYAQKDKKKDAPAVDSSKLSGEFVGTLKTTPGSDRVFILTTETQKLIPPKNYNPRSGGNANVSRVLSLQNQLANDQRQIQTARSPQQRNQAMQRVQQHTLQLQRAYAQISAAANKNGGLPPGYRYDTVKQDVEFQASETAKVRTMLLPESFDDKGNPKKYTQKEKDELKGKDKTAVGYESSLEKLEAGAKIRVVLGHAPAKKKEEADKSADKDEMKDLKDNTDKKMQVKLLVILEESKGSPAPPPKKKAK
jgi:hypothetical protein